MNRALEATLPIVYDAGALVAAEADAPYLRAIHTTALNEGRALVVPTPVLTQVWRNGARQARVARLLRGCRLEPTSEPVAKHAGVLLGRTRTSDAVDAIVVATAVTHSASIVTSDPDDLAALIEAAAVARPPALVRI